jgi:hypothetical protein
MENQDIRKLHVSKELNELFKILRKFEDAEPEEYKSIAEAIPFLSLSITPKEVVDVGPYFFNFKYDDISEEEFKEEYPLIDNDSLSYDSQETIMHDLVYKGNIEILSILLDKVPQLAFMKNVYGTLAFPFESAGFQNKIDILDLFLGKLPNIPEVYYSLNEQNLMYDAIEFSDKHNKYLEYILNKYPKMAQEYCPCSRPFAGFPIELAVYNDNLNAAKMILNKFPEMYNLKNDKGRALIHLAAQRDSTKIIEHFLEKNPQMAYWKDNEGNLPIHYATTSNDYNPAAIKMLKKHAPNSLYMLNNGGQDAFDVALGLNINVIFALLPDFTDAIPNINALGKNSLYKSISKSMDLNFVKLGIPGQFSQEFRISSVWRALESIKISHGPNYFWVLSNTLKFIYNNNLLQFNYDPKFIHILQDTNLLNLDSELEPKIEYKDLVNIYQQKVKYITGAYGYREAREFFGIPQKPRKKALENVFNLPELLTKILLYVGYNPNWLNNEDYIQIEADRLAKEIEKYKNSDKISFFSNRYYTEAYRACFEVKTLLLEDSKSELKESFLQKM